MSWFGGICCVPRACLKNEKTTTSLTKLVITKSREGASTKSVKTIRTFKELTSSVGLFEGEMEISTVGSAESAAKIFTLNNKKNSKVLIIYLPKVKNIIFIV